VGRLLRVGDVEHRARSAPGGLGVSGRGPAPGLPLAYQVEATYCPDLPGADCTTAYKRDGGGSSTMYFMGEVVNDPLGRGQEREVGDILYVVE
jgi:hypothetical protein